MSVPRSVHVLTGVLGLSAIALCGVIGVPQGSVPTDATGLLAMAGVAVVLTVAGAWRLEFRRGDEVEAVDLFEAALMPAVMLFAGPVAVGLTAASKVASQRQLGIAPAKAAFNVAQWSFASAVASAVFLAFRAPGPQDAGAMLPLVAATTAAMVLSHLAVVLVLATVRRMSPGRVLSDLGGVVTSTWLTGGVANLALGLLFSALTAWAPQASILALIPLAMYDAAHRASEAARTDRRRLTFVQRATAALSGAVEPLDAIPQVLEEVRECFYSRTAELVRLEMANPHPLADLARATAGTDRTGRLRGVDHQLDELLDAHGFRNCIASPIPHDGRGAAVLLVPDPGGLEGSAEGEAAVMTSFAGAIGTAFQRHTSTQAILAERRLLAQVFDTTSDGVVAIDADNRIVTWNPAMERLTGYGVTEVNTTADLEVLAAEDEDGQQVSIDFDAGSQATLPAEIRIRTRQGTISWFGCSYATAGSTGRQSPLLVMTIRDITVARAEAQLQHEFVAIASHELRTPATVVQGMAQTLMTAGEQMTPEQRKRAISGVHRGALRMHRVVTNVLAVARVENGNKIALESFTLGDVVEKAIDEVCGEAGIDPSRIKVDPELEDVGVHANDSATMQILVNLLSNAVKYGDGHPVDISATVRDSRVRIDVHDQGPGIPLHEQSRIFRRFERLHQHNMQAGTGLGLYISRRLAELCDGHLELASAPGEGATFTLTLPAAERRQDEPAAGADPLEVSLAG